jgi:sugar O-acyltransferase (sialic acid O-acetyltransferase NeuD family)
MKKNIIILGTGAVAAELTSFIEDSDMGELLGLCIKGYLGDDENTKKLHHEYKLEKPILGNLVDYKIEEKDYFVIGVTNLDFRKKAMNLLLPRGAVFPTLIHPSAIIARTATIGMGNLINPQCIIGPNAVIGDFNILTSQSFISHDVIVGDGNNFSTALLCGYVKVGNNNNFFIRSTVIPSLTIGNNNVIQAGMVVDKNIGDGETVFYKHKEKIIAIPKKC